MGIYRSSLSLKKRNWYHTDNPSIFWLLLCIDWHKTYDVATNIGHVTPILISELSSYVLEIPNDAYTTLSQHLVKTLLNADWFILQIMRRQLTTLMCPIIDEYNFDETIQMGKYHRRFQAWHISIPYSWSQNQTPCQSVYILVLLGVCSDLEK